MAEPARAEAGRGAPPRLQDTGNPPPAPRRRPARGSSVARRAVHALAVVLALLPLADLTWRLVTDQLGGEPIDIYERATGLWALRFLVATLAVTPLRQLGGWSALAPYRRTFGLLAFGYATVHLLAYLVLDMVLDLSDIVEDVIEHPYATVGMLAWLTLLPLAVTSTKGWARRLGGVRWRKLHRLAYVAALAATVHFLWSVKKDVTEPLTYAAIFAVLLGARVLLARRRADGAPAG